MGSKTISLSDEAYERLLRRKTGKESFSDVVVRITNNVDILDLSGVLSEKDAQALKRNVEDARKRSNKRSHGIRI